MALVPVMRSEPAVMERVDFRNDRREVGRVMLLLEMRGHGLIPGWWVFVKGKAKLVA